MHRCIIIVLFSLCVVVGLCIAVVVVVVFLCQFVDFFALVFIRVDV